MAEEEELPPLTGIIFLEEFNITLDTDKMSMQAEIPHARLYSRSLFIRYYLSEVNPQGDYPLNMHRIWTALQKRAQYHHISQYSSFRNAIYVLKATGLIRESGATQEADKRYPTAFRRVMYKVVPSELGNPAWMNPLAAFRIRHTRTGKPPTAPDYLLPGPPVAKPKRAPRGKKQ